MLLGDLGNPRVEGSFSGRAMRAWNVPWGALEGRAVITQLADDFGALGTALEDGEISQITQLGEQLDAVVSSESVSAWTIRSGRFVGSNSPRRRFSRPKMSLAADGCFPARCSAHSWSATAWA